MDNIIFAFYAFTSVFIVVNPFGGLLTFISLTEGMNELERKQIAKRSVIIAGILALVFALAGEIILRIFNITVDNLRVAGGVLLFVIALDMLHGRMSRESVTPEEMKDASRRENISVFPIATPLLTGPGAITTVIVVIRSGGAVVLKLIAIAAIVLTFLVTYLIFRYSTRLYRMLGVTVSLVITRIMGLLLAAIAVNFIAVGIWNIYMSFR